uniref:CWF19-like protein 2 n=1 Tax=Danio rerio TaxID=7955 RepID=C19L2_DANRE|nr:RecName: Full=CWF19-like protein 2 [Danio rerio]ABA19230.1 CWF19-like 2 [Danio rerio]
MAAYGVNFESANSIKSRKESKREERERVIQKAKEKFEKEERRKAERKARGEDTWMLPDVDLRLQQIGEEHTVKTKKAKKEKKAKKSKKEKKKKAKKEKKDEGDASCDSSEDSEDEWVEATLPSGGKDKSLEGEPEATPSSSSASNNQRDEWMTFDFLAMKTTSVADRRAQKEAEKEAERQKAQAIEQAGLHRLELNPYWKDGGSGLPPEESSSTAVKKAGVVNDGGVSWLRKSYQRMKEQADREQRSLDSVVAERYGSMEEFQKRLKEAEDAAYGERRDDEKERGRREEGKESWRRNDREEGRERWRRDEEKDRWRRNDRDEGRERWRREDGDEEKERWRKDGWRRGENEDRRRERSPNAERERARSRDDLSSKFLKPSEDEEVSRGAGFKKGSSSNQSAAFRKPVDDVEMSREAGFKKGSSSNQNAAFRKPVDDEMSRGTAFKKGSSSNQSAAFRKPVDGDHDDDEMSRGAEFRKSSSSNQSAAFRKPIDNNNDGRGVAAAWRKSSAVQDSETPTLQKHTEKSAALQEDSKTTTTVSSSESEEEEEEELILTDEEMNKLGAKIVKAEIMGNTALLEKLRAQMEAARRAKEKRAQIKDQSKRASKPAVSEKEVLLFRTDPSGRAWPVNAPSETLEPRGGRRKRKAIETHQDGERVRYFDDDDGVDLREMVRREKMSSAEDQNALYSRMAAKMMGRTDGDNYTLDDMFVSSAAQKERAGRDEERQRNKAVQETRRLAGRMEKCPHCFDSAELPKHLIIAVGTKVYLCLPNSVSLTEGHCLIVPVQHHTAATGLDEDIWGEIQMFRRALVRMFESQELDCVFLETHMNPKRHLHMVYECVPMPRELGDMAPIYFKKAIMESDEEWAMNKKVVDLSKRDIRQAVPRGLPYFSVDFGLQGGFAHVIENEQKFPHYFGKEILGGMLDLEPRRWRKPIRENFDDQRKKVLKFAQWWKPFDCTKSDS